MRKLLALMGMAVKQNDEIIVQVVGEDEDACAAAIEKFLKENF
jgi:phosphocarrier protein